MTITNNYKITINYKIYTFNMIVLIFFLSTSMFQTEGNGIHSKRYGHQWQPKTLLNTLKPPNFSMHTNEILFNNKGQGPIYPSIKILLGDILCQFCRLTNDMFCIERFCIENTNKVGKPNSIRSSTPVLGDALCQFCIKTNNITCIERFCNKINSQVPEPERIHQLPANISAAKRALRANTKGNIIRRSLQSLEFKQKADVQTNISILGDILCQRCIEQNDLMCIEIYCNQPRTKADNTDEDGETMKL